MTNQWADKKDELRIFDNVKLKKRLDEKILLCLVVAGNKESPSNHTVNPPTRICGAFT
jgi:hypothetical protein